MEGRLEEVRRLWEDLEEDHEAVLVVEVEWPEKPEAATARVVDHKALLVPLVHMPKLPLVRMARMLQSRRGWEQRYVVVADRRLQAWVVSREPVRNGC